MKIGIDARLWNETGVGRYIRSLFKYLPLLDKENDYIWFFRNREYREIALPLNNWKKVLADVRWHSLSEQFILPWIFYKEKLDLLHFPYFSFPIIYPGKFVVTIHDLIFDHHKTGKTSTLPPIWYALKKIGYHLIVWTSIKRAEKIITLSNDAKKEIIDHYDADSKKIIVTYESGTLEDTKTDFSLAKFKKIQKLQPYLLYVGNAHPHKNVEALLEAIEVIKNKEKDWKLVLIGSDKFFYPRLVSYIKKKKLEKAVRIVGEVPNREIAVWYYFAKGFVTASKMEGFGIPPLEAMSMGCPAIVSDIPVFHEIYAEGATYFNQNNPENIAQIVLNTLKNKQLVDQLIKRGHYKAKEYSWEKMVSETITIYESCTRL